MCEYCENPNNTITSHPIGVSAFVGAGRLLLRFYDEELDRTIVTGSNIHFCPMCGRKLKAGNSRKALAEAVKLDKELKKYGNED